MRGWEDLWVGPGTGDKSPEVCRRREPCDKRPGGWEEPGSWSGTRVRRAVRMLAGRRVDKDLEKRLDLSFQPREG